MKKITFYALCLTILGLSFVFTAAQSQAQTENQDKPQVQTRSFPGVTTFTTATGRLGFFEQGTGKIFVYDSNFENCVFKGQLTELGEPITLTDDAPKTKPKSKSYE